jgi:hypothetical protein
MRSPLAIAALALAASATALAAPYDSTAPTPVPPSPVEASADLDVAEARVEYLSDLDLLVFQQDVKGTAGGTLPRRRGTFDGAGVLAYLFPTSLSPQDVGFVGASGTVALAVMSHPDFDDTPLWDESGNGKPGDDGAAWHAHWIVLVPDRAREGDLSAQEIAKGSAASTLPPTAPEMNVYLDSPGFPVLLRGGTLRVLVPAQRVRGNTDFTFDATVAYLQVSTHPDAPALGVYRVYDALSGGRKLPFKVVRR